MKPEGSPQAAQEPRAWHALEADAALAAIESDLAEGLSEDAARRRFAQFGPNRLPQAKRRSTLSVFLGQFKSPLVYLLFVAAAIALALGHVSDAAVIFTVVLLNSLIGSFQEGRAERSLDALRKLATQKARLVRGGREQILEAGDVVPGDVLLLEAGDAVAADARLLHGAALQVAEAALTGESLPVSKNLLVLPSDTLLADRQNMVYAGTHVTAGRARVVVVATGLATQIGHIAALAGTAEKQETPLERRVAQFGRYIMVAAGGLFVAVNLIGYLHGLPFAEIIMIGISQVVGMVPEGLPVAMTVALAVGVQRMARRHAVVRRLTAVETLGSTTVICTDKTGTLTRNEMTVTAVHLPGGVDLAVTGAGYGSDGQLLEDGREPDAAYVPTLHGLLAAGVLCNDAELQPPTQAAPGWKPIGDPTEVALLSLALKGGLVPSALRASSPRRAEIPFDAATKMMATQHDTPDGARIFIKGAPEVVLNLCTSARHPNGQDLALDPESRSALHDAAERMANQALRVLAIGEVKGAELDPTRGLAALNGRVTLLGLLGQIDPPRTEVKDAVDRCRDAGIRTVMVTGDHKATGHAIAKTLGIARDGDEAVDGRELEQMSDAELAQRIERISVFARVHPAQKLRIVDAYQKQREVVAMTGDGVNDAPALIRADVGVAMGITGTEVAKNASKVVLADDNFATIAAAVEEGRVVYRNIQKVVLYLFSTSVAEMLVLLTTLALGYPPPLAAVQILWINLVTEATVTVNLIMDPADGDEMQMAPISPDEPLITRLLLFRMAFITPAITASTMGWFIYRIEAGVPFAQVQTETFSVLAVCQWFNVLNCRSDRRSALNLSIFRNRWLVGGLVVSNVLQALVIYWRPLGKVFHAVPLSIGEVVAIGAVASLVLWVEELRKLALRLRERSALAVEGSP